MDKSRRRVVWVAAGAALLWTATALAAPTPETSLNNCQKAVKTEGRKFIQKTVNAVGTCLKAVAKDVIQKNVAISASTSSTCVAQFRKVNDTRAPAFNTGLIQKLKNAVEFKCDPGVNPLLTHTFADIMGMAGGTLEDIKTSNIDTWCKRFNSVATIASVPDWEACITGSHNCEAAAAILAAFPRALEWITDLQLPLINMNAVVSPPSDLTRTSDAVAGAALFQALLDPNSDGVANPTCGGEGVACVTGCCYVENGPPVPDVNCFEWTAPLTAAGAFFGACAGPGIAGFQTKVATVGPCGPVSPPPFPGIPCVGPPNMVIIPTDPTCP